jgi:hypothetical protein
MPDTTTRSYESQHKTQHELKRERKLLYAVVILLFVAMAALFPNELLAIRSDYSTKISTIYENSNFALVYHLWTMVLATSLAFNLCNTGRPLRTYLLSLGFLSALAFVTFSKGPFILGMFVSLIFAHRIGARYQLLVIFGIVVLFALSLFTIVPVFSWYRYTGEVDFTALQYAKVELLFSDGRGPLLTTAIALHYEQNTEVHSLVSSLFLWIPKFLWSTRPLDVAESFARANMPGWQPGFGFGMSPITEGIIRFGVIGSPIIMIFFAACMIFFRMLFLRSIDPKLRAPIDLVSFGYVAFMMNRSPLSGVASMVLQFWLPYLLFTILFRIFSSSKKTSKLPELTSRGRRVRSYGYHATRFWQKP